MNHLRKRELQKTIINQIIILKTKKNAYKAGVDEFIGKPIRSDELKKIMIKWVITDKAK